MNLAKVGGILVATILSAVLAALTGDQTIDPTEWINVLIGAVGVVVVYVVPNVEGSIGKYAKGAVAVAMAGLVFLQSGISDGMTSTEWIQLGLAMLGAVGVGVLPGPMVTGAVTASIGRRYIDGEGPLPPAPEGTL